MSDAVRSVVDSLDVKVKVSVAELLNPPSDTDAVIDEVGAVPSYVYVKEAEPVLEFPAASVNVPSAIDMDLDPSPLGVNVAE